MAINRVAIIDTNALSVSIALKLKQENESLEVVGYDVEAATADMARAQGAFDRVEREAGPACEGADLVIVTAPLDAMRETFAAIAPHLQSGSLVTDTAELKAPVVRWAQELLPEDVDFVGGHPLLNPVVAEQPTSFEEPPSARADLLNHALYCFTPHPATSAAALETCSALAETLDAYAFFIDVTEHDGLEAGVAGLVDLVSVALLRATVDTPGWEEMRKFAGHRFATATEAAAEASERHHALFLNRTNVAHRLDVLLRELTRLRELLAEDDADALETTFREASEGRERWLEAREQGVWVEEGTFAVGDVPGVGEQLGRMIFGDLGARLKNASGRDQDQ